ncbi:PDZ domain-containing protein [Microbulbifer sp. TYP-18]|uniref:PDZ domain-containing protein n=1 Tax=Microbulbifer sp. TYP-18 TaxID=3230024 RepID=UPI0034C6177D
MRSEILIAAAGVLALVPAAYIAAELTGEASANPAPAATDTASLELRVARLESSLQRINDIQGRLLELVGDIQAQADGTPTADHADPAAPDRQTSASQPRSRRDSQQRLRDHQLQQLLRAGMHRDRAELVLRRQERFNYEHMSLSHSYHHLADKGSAEALALREQMEHYRNPRRALADELTDAEFEAYLQVIGGPADMQVRKVVIDTPAAAAGLQPGDRIVSYNGQRVFHMGDLRREIYKVPPGKNVAIEVKRAETGQKDTLFVPSGPLGIRG